MSALLADIDAALGTAPPPSSGTGAPSSGMFSSEIDAALSGTKPREPANSDNKGSEFATQAANLAAGANTSILAGIPGLPGDVANLISRNVGYGEPFAGTPYFNEKLARLGVGTASIPEPAKRELAQDVGQGIGAMAGPNVLAKGRAISGILGPAARSVEEVLGAGSVPANAVIGGVAGAGGYGGKEALEGTGYEDLGQAAGSLAGGVGAGVGAAATIGFGRGIAGGYRVIPPLRGATREPVAAAAAADRFRSAAVDPYASFEAVGTTPRELVPGSLPTTAELSGDVGLLGSQRYREVQSPDFGREIVQRRGEANTARMGALEEQTPGAASIEDTQAHIRRLLAGIDQSAEAEAAAQRSAAGAALPGARLAPEETGALARAAVEAERAPQTTALTEGEQSAIGRASEASGQFGGQEATGSVEQRAAAPGIYGQQMREPLAQSYAAEQRRLRDLRESIDPTGTMGMRPDTIKAALGEIDRMFPAEGGAQLSGAERGLYGTVNSWGDLIPIERAFQLRANINGRIRGLQGSDPQEALRLGMLKDGVDEALAQAVNDIGVGERAGVIHQGQAPISNRFLNYEKVSNQPPRRPQDLMQFLMERGGLKDEAGELHAMDLQRVNKGYFGRLSRENGMPLDDARELAAEAGYLHPDSDVNDLIAALHRNQSGHPVFREGDNDALAWMEYDRARRSGDLEIPFGESTARGEPGGGIPPRTAQSASAPRGGALSAGSRAGSAESGRPSGTAGTARVQQEPLVPLSAEARATFAGWNAGYREMGQTFRGETPGTLHAVGKILQKGGAYDSYRLTDAEVPWIMINRSRTAGDAVGRFLAAAPPEAHAALDDAIAFSMRGAAQKADGTLDLPKYEKWARDHGSVLSARPELMQKFGTAAAAQRQLDDIRAQLAEHAATHPLKPGWEDASILPRYFKAGPEGAERMREYQRITGGRPEALDAAADHAAYSFAASAVRNGEVVPRLAEAWLRSHDEALSAMPGLKDQFANATEAQRRLEYSIAVHDQARKDFTQSVVGAMLGDDPARAVERVFSGSARQQKAALMMQITGNSQAAREGLQRAAIDYIRGKFEGAPLAGSEAGALMPKRFADFVEQNRDVLTTLFPGRIQNFDAIAADLKRASLVGSARVNKGGSDTAELTAGRDHGGHGNDIGMATTAILAERLGEHAHHLLGSLGSTIGAVGSVIGKMVLGKAKNALTVRADQLFDRMLLDPDFALEMNRRYPATAKAQRSPIGDRLRGRIIQQTIASTRTGLAN